MFRLAQREEHLRLKCSPRDRSHVAFRDRFLFLGQSALLRATQEDVRHSTPLKPRFRLAAWMSKSQADPHLFPFVEAEGDSDLFPLPLGEGEYPEPPPELRFRRAQG